KEAANGLPPTVNVELGSINHPLIVSTGDDDKSPLIIGLEYGALEFPANHPRYLIGAERLKFGSDLGETLPLHLGCGDSTFELGQFDLGLFDLRADLQHLF